MTKRTNKPPANRYGGSPAQEGHRGNDGQTPAEVKEAQIIEQTPAELLEPEDKNEKKNSKKNKRLNLVLGVEAIPFEREVEEMEEKLSVTSGCVVA